MAEEESKQNAPATAERFADDGDLVKDQGPIDIDGVKYVAVTERTFDHDIYLMDHVRAAGLDRLDKLGIADDSDPDQAAMAILTHVYRSGKTFDLLAGVLAREGTEWSPEQAAENKPVFARTKDPAVKVRLQEALIYLVLGFFATALASSATSPSSSTQEPGTASAGRSAAGSATSGRKKNAPRRRTVAAPSTTATGAPS